MRELSILHSSNGGSELNDGFEEASVVVGDGRGEVGILAKRGRGGKQTGHMDLSGGAEDWVGAFVGLG